MTRKANIRALLSLVTALLLIGSQAKWVAAANHNHVPSEATVTSTSQDDATETYRSGELLIKFKPGRAVTAMGALQTLTEVSAEKLDDLGALDVERWQVPPGQELSLAATLQALPEVEYAEPNYKVYAHLTPNDPYYDLQWAHPMIDSEEAWDLTTGDSSVIVAVIDTGVDLDHPELQDRLTAGKSYIDDAPTPDDDEGHGTHVAGIIAAAGNNSQGVAGMAWQTQIMPLKVLDSKGQGYDSDVAQAIIYAVDNGAQIINVSLGGPDASSTLYNAVQYAYANNVLVVGSAGNCGSGDYSLNGCERENQPIYPAAYDTEVFAVAATEQSDTVADFSNQGDYVDIAAPGVRIASTVPDGYAYADGTSQAAPFVTGLAALLLSIDPGLTSQEIQTTIENSATDLGTEGWDQDCGAGRINALAAVMQLAELTAPDLYDIDNADRDQTFVVDWSDVDGSSAYTLQEADTAEFNSPTTRYSGSTSQATVSNVDAGTWYYRVRAENGNVTSEWSAVQSVTVGLDTPVIDPVGNDGAPSYTLTWNSVTAATAYRLQESGSSDFSSATTYDVGAGLAYSVTNQVGGTWYYRVQGYNATTASPWSATRSVMVVPQSPTLLPLVTGVVSDAYTVTWTTVTGAEGYRLQEADTLDFSNIITRYVGSNTTYEVTGQAGGTWHYRIQAYNQAGSGEPSKTEAITVTAAEVEVPNLQPILNDDKDDTYPITWSEVPSATAYILEESSTPWFSEPAVAYTGPATQTLTSGQAVGLWHYRVRAVAPLGNSPWSATQSVRVRDYVYLPIIARSDQP